MIALVAGDWEERRMGEDDAEWREVERMSDGRRGDVA